MTTPRHRRWAEGVRAAVRAWGLEIWCKEPKYYSSSLTAILMSSISSTEYPAMAATPLAVRRKTRESEGSGGSRTTTGPSTVVSCTTALDREVLSGAGDLQEPTHFRADSLQRHLFPAVAGSAAGAQQAS